MYFIVHSSMSTTSTPGDELSSHTTTFEFEFEFRFLSHLCQLWLICD